MYKKLTIFAANCIVVALAPAYAETPAVGSLPPGMARAAVSDPAGVLLERAKYWENRDRIDLAKEALEKLFQIAPDHPDGLSMMGLIEARAEHLDSARKIASKLRGVKPDHPALSRIETLIRLYGEDKSKLQRARLLAKTGHTDEALAVFHKLYPNGPPGGDLAFEYWQLVAESKDGWLAARNGLNELVRENPQNLRYRLALAEHETSRLPLKMQALQVIIDMAKMPEYSLQARKSWRSVLLRLENSPASLPLLAEYLAAEPDDSAIKERQQAIIQAQATRRQLTAEPGYRAKTKNTSLLDRMDPADAELLLEERLRAHPEDADAVGEMGLLRLRQGKHAQAFELFTRALHLTRGKSGKWQSLARTARFWQLMRESSDARDAGDLTLAENKLHAARQLDSQEPNAIAALARIRADRGQIREAESGYRQALSIDPVNSSALNGLLSLYRQQGMTDNIQQTIAQLSPAQRSALGASLNRMEAFLLQDQADRLIANGQHDEAIALLEQAVRVDADDPWLRFDLAKQYARRSNPAKGQALLDDFLARHPDDADALYALALYQSSQDDISTALKTLSRIEASQRSQKIAQLQKHLQVRSLAQDARLLAKSGRQSEARQRLSEAETLGSGDEDLTLAVAFEWAELGDIQHSRALFDKARTAHAPPSITWHLRYAELLAMIGADLELRDELDVIAGINSLSPTDAAALAELQESAALRLADKQVLAGNASLAHQTLAPFLKNKPDQVRLLLADARAYRAERQWLPAQAGYTRILQLDPSDREARSGLIEALVASGNRAVALQQVNEWDVNRATNDLPTDLHLIGLYLSLEEYGRARQLNDPLLISHPDHPRVLNYAWQIAQNAGRLDEEIDYLKKSFAAEQAERNPSAYQSIGIGEFGDPGKIERDWKEKKLAALIDRRSNWFSSAADVRYRNGTAGLSRFYSVEIPLEYKTTWRANDEVFFRTDLIKLHAGNVASGNESFGSMLLCQPACMPALLQQSAQGASFTAGYQSDNLRADLGVTPLNFPVSNIVGGVRQNGRFGELSYSLEASRRPVTGSLLSFAGTRDPNTDKVWGGVVATGGNLGLSLDKGETFGFWSSAGLHSLTGRNVQTNGRTQLMAGGQWRVVNEENRLLSLGLTGMYWHHTQNAGEYTFGHGGYYSPLNYRSLSLPVTYAGRLPRFSYLLRAAVSASQAQMRDAPYYPTLSVSQLPANFIMPVYAGGSSSGRGYSLKAAGEYQVEPKLFVGGMLSLDRSQSYAPNRLMFYMRYSLDHPAAQPVFMPPEPVESSSQF